MRRSEQIEDLLNAIRKVDESKLQEVEKDFMKTVRAAARKIRVDEIREAQEGEEYQGDQWGLYKVEPGAGCPVCGNEIPFYEVSGKIDRKIDLIKRMQTEMDHRAEVEEKAVQLITEGRHGEAVALLNTLDHSLIGRMQEEFDPIEAAGGKANE